ncbi:MAG: hypothetical protein AAB840_00335, partial [Patescibacteria group bacterium]
EAIENIRSKPRGAKQRIALFLAVFMTLILFSAWLYTAPKTLVENTDKTISEEISPNVDIATPLENIKEEINNLGQIWSSFESQFENASSTE